VKRIREMFHLILSKFGLRIIKLKKFEEMNQSNRYVQAFKILEFFGGVVNLLEFSRLVKLSKSQLSQDLFVLRSLDFKREGFFVEFGATNGVDLSNTCLLEKEFNWSGILAEPSKVWHKDLVKNRSCQIELNAIWSKSNEILSFLETSSPELSTINRFNNLVFHNRIGITYNVNTISLMDLLIKYDAPQKIDYLSIDTEGSEYDILKSFDFNYFRFRVITIEHNYTSQRDKVYKLLTSKGYRRVLNEITLFDDWYILNIE
jgi:FkbM family methyltransferase